MADNPIRKDARANLAIADGDHAPTQLTANGDLRARDDDAITALGTLNTTLGSPKQVDATSYVRVAVDAAKNGTRDLIAAPGADKQLWIYAGIFTTDANGTVKFIDSTPADLTGTMPIAANGGFVLPISPKASAPWYKCATNTKFQAVLSANSDLDGSILYAIVDV